MTTPHDTPYCRIKNPENYVRGRDYQPIDVIEAFGLCHHLACAVKYIARAGHKDNYLEDLKKADWYVCRELQRQACGKKPCHEALTKEPIYDVIKVCEDWNLPGNLSMVLFLILKFSYEPRAFDWLLKRYAYVGNDIGTTLIVENLLLKAHEYIQEEIEVSQRD